MAKGKLKTTPQPPMENFTESIQTNNMVSAPQLAQGPRPVSQSQLPDDPSHSQAGELADCASQAASLSPQRDIFFSQSDLDKVLCDSALRRA